jgi:hypothetical protein
MKDLKEFLETEEAKKIKALEESTGLRLDGMMMTAYEEWSKDGKI